MNDTLSGLLCVLCLNGTGQRRPADVLIDGHSLCEPHQYDVLNHASFIWLNSDDSLNLKATIAAIRETGGS